MGRLPQGSTAHYCIIYETVNNPREQCLDRVRRDGIALSGHLFLHFDWPALGLKKFRKLAPAQSPFVYVAPPWQPLNVPLAYEQGSEFSPILFYYNLEIFVLYNLCIDTGANFVLSHDASRR